MDAFASVIEKNDGSSIITLKKNGKDFWFEPLNPASTIVLKILIGNQEQDIEEVKWTSGSMLNSHFNKLYPPSCDTRYGTKLVNNLYKSLSKIEGNINPILKKNFSELEKIDPRYKALFEHLPRYWLANYYALGISFVLKKQ